MQAATGIASTRCFPSILHLGLGLNLIPFENDFAGRLFDADADGLFARFGRTGVADDVIAEDEILGFTAHTNAGGVGFAAVVLDHIVFKAIAMAGHALGFVA